MKRAWHVLLLGLLLGAPPAAPRAAELLFVEDECNGRHLILQGPIEAGDYERFADRLAELVAVGRLPDVQDPDVLWTVELDSPGGDLAEAMGIGRLLRAGLATTNVGYRFARRPDGVLDFARSGDLVCLDGDGRLAGCAAEIVEARCTGACLLIWLAGARRHANEGHLGQHGLADGASDVAAYLTEMGVAPAWRARLLTTEPEGDGWLAWPERHALAGSAQVLRDLVGSCPAALDADASFRSVTDPDPQVRERLMARAEAHRQCRRQRLDGARQSLVSSLRTRRGADSVAAH